MSAIRLSLLYIDPGTGSMLFSIIIGAAATLFFLFRALMIKLKSFLSGGGAVAQSASSFVIYNEGKQYWNVFKPVLDEFEKNGRELLYLCSAEDDPVFAAGYRHIKSEYIGEGNRAFAQLNLLSADVVLMTTPGLDVYQLKRSRSVKHYSHVLHAPSDATMYRMFGIDYFDSVLLTGDYQAEGIRALEKTRGLREKQLIVAGCAYLDALSEKLKTITAEAEHRFTVLVSPTWGPSGILSRYGEKLLDPLAKTGWRIIVRPHPQSKKSEPAVLEKLQNRYKESENMLWDFERDNLYSLAKADIMISDFSGIIFDFIFLFDKPVMYVTQSVDLRPYDAGDLDGELWQFKTLKKIGIELREDSLSAVGEAVSAISDSIELREARRRAKEEAWFHQGKAGEKIYAFMLQTKENQR